MSKREHVGTLDILTSDYIKKSSFFFKDKRPSLLVLVEGEDDVPFWRKMFDCIKDEYRQIDVHTLKSASVNALQLRSDAGDLLESPGKDALLKVEKLGKNKVVAVDADYDLIMDNRFSKRIVEDPFVIPTRYYSIENHLLELSALQNLSFWRNEDYLVEKKELMQAVKSFGNCVMNVVKLCIASKIRRNGLQEKNSEDDFVQEVITIKEIWNLLANVQFLGPCFEVELNELKKTLEQSPKVMKLLSDLQEDMEGYKQWTVEDALQYLQGHTLYAVVSKMIKYYLEIVLKKKEEVIRNCAVDRTKIPEHIIEMHNSLGLLPGMNWSEYVKKIVYDADAVEANSPGTLAIQNEILKILE